MPRGTEKAAEEQVRLRPAGRLAKNAGDDTPVGRRWGRGRGAGESSHGRRATVEGLGQGRDVD